MNEKDGSFRSSRTTVNSLTALDYRKGGLSMIGAAVFIIGEMAGSGILTLPSAIAKESWIGIGVLIFCAVISAHASVYLAECWMMVEEKWPKYRTAQTRNPFSVIGIKAVGPYMKYVCSFFMDIQLFGVCVVFLILMSQLFKQIYDQFIPADYHFAFCIWIMILGGILIPLSWLGSPHDLTFIAYGAMGCTIISCFLVLFILLGEAPVKMPYADYTLDTSLKGLGDFALAFGTILFVFGGTCSFPTFQKSMEDSRKFPKAVYVGFVGMLLLYLPIAIFGYATYGIKCDENILNNADPGTVKTMINFLMAFHLFCAYLICLNPLNLDVEEYLKIKNSFNVRRILFRTTMTALIIFVALSVPKFGKILAFIGAFSVSAVAYILTPWFYINLCKMEVGESVRREIPTYRLCYLIFIIVVGCLGGCISTYSSVRDMVGEATFVPPCYAGGWN